MQKRDQDGRIGLVWSLSIDALDDKPFSEGLMQEACFRFGSSRPWSLPAMPGPVLPNAAVRGSDGYGSYAERSHGSPSQKDVKTSPRRVPRYRSAMMEGSPSNKGRISPGARGAANAAKTRRQRTAMLVAEGTPKANARIEHSRTAMLPAGKSVAEEDGTQSTSSLVSFVQGKVKGLVESVRRN